MCYPKEFVPEGLKNYWRLVLAKLRHRNCFVGSPWVGRRVTLGRGCSISRGVELGDDVGIGDYSYVNCYSIIASGRIGKFCSIGPHTIIGMPEHPTSYLSTSPRLYAGGNLFGRPSPWRDFPAPPVIGSDVWIGASVFVRQGVEIGHGAVVGAGAVVTRDVPPYGVAAGVPARLIRYRFEPRAVKLLLRTRWWEASVDGLAPFAGCFQQPWNDLPGPDVWPVRDHAVLDPVEEGPPC